MEILEIVEKLIGEIEPIGVSEVDEKRLYNLYELIELTDDLIERIRVVAKNKTRHEDSMKTAGNCADKFLQRIKQES
jgi:hypothetical protein